MTHEEFHEQLDKQFSRKEGMFMTFCILYHPDHSDYYSRFRKGEYEYCLQYLNDNRHLLSIDNVPSHQKDIVNKMLSHLNNLKGKS